MSLWLGILSSSGSSIPAIGENVYGGYMAGVIDTTRSGSIDATDYYQTGARYLLIVAPKSLQTSSQFSTTSTFPSQMKTRWNGLGATTAMNSSSSDYTAANYCYNLSYPSDGHSRWYLPAIDELELIYRNLKPTTDGNSTGNRFSSSDTWSAIAGKAMGENISSDPTGVAYTTGSPAQTSLADFKVSGSQSMTSTSIPINKFWSSTSYLNTLSFNAAVQIFQSTTSPTVVAQQEGDYYSNGNFIRPVRRILL